MSLKMNYKNDSLSIKIGFVYFHNKVLSLLKA